MIILLMGKGRREMVAPVSGATTAADERPQSSPVQSPVLQPSNDQPRVEQLRRRIAALEQELQAARSASARVEKPVMISHEPQPSPQTESVPLPFPANLPPEYLPEQFQAIAFEAAKSCGMGLDVFAVDCSEFPCIAWTRAADPNVTKFSMEGCTAWRDSFEGEFVLGTTIKDPNGMEVRYLGWMPTPPDKALSVIVSQRAQDRAREMITSLGGWFRSWPLENRRQ